MRIREQDAPRSRRVPLTTPRRAEKQVDGSIGCRLHFSQSRLPFLPRRLHGRRRGCTGVEGHHTVSKYLGHLWKAALRCSHLGTNPTGFVINESIYRERERKEKKETLTFFFSSCPSSLSPKRVNKHIVIFGFVDMTCEVYTKRILICEN